MNELNAYFFWSLGDRSSLRSPQRGVYPRFMPVPSTHLTSNQLLQKRKAAAQGAEMIAPSSKRKLMGQLARDRPLDYEGPPPPVSEFASPQGGEQVVEAGGMGVGKQNAGGEAQEMAGMEMEVERANPEVIEQRAPLEMNAALAAVFEKNGALREKLRLLGEDLREEKGWLEEWRQEIEREAEELRKHRKQRERNPARRVVEEIFEEREPRVALSVIEAGEATFSEEVLRKKAELEKLEQERKAIKLGQLEADLRLLELKGRNDFELKTNEIAMLKN